MDRPEAKTLEETDVRVVEKVEGLLSQATGQHNNASFSRM